MKYLHYYIPIAFPIYSVEKHKSKQPNNRIDCQIKFSIQFFKSVKETHIHLHLTKSSSKTYKMTSTSFTDWIISNQQSTSEQEKELEWNITLQQTIEKEMITLKPRRSKRIAKKQKDEVNAAYEVYLKSIAQADPK